MRFLIAYLLIIDTFYDTNEKLDVSSIADINNQEWIYISSLSSKRAHMNCAAIGNNIYLIGICTYSISEDKIPIKIKHRWL